jgi:hypothetical protein
MASGMFTTAFVKPAMASGTRFFDCGFNCLIVFVIILQSPKVVYFDGGKLKVLTIPKMQEERLFLGAKPREITTTDHSPIGAML